MPLIDAIKAQLDRAIKAGKYSVSLIEKGLIEIEDIKNLVELLNRYPTISEVDLSRNSLSGENSKTLAKLQYVTKITLISSDIDYDDALILCANEKFCALVLNSQDLGKGSIDQLKQINRTNPLKIIITSGIDFERHLDKVIILGPQQEITRHLDATLELTEEVDRKKNNSDESTESKATAPMSIDMQNPTAPNNSLTCCPSVFCWPTKKTTNMNPPQHQP